MHHSTPSLSFPPFHIAIQLHLSVFNIGFRRDKSPGRYGGHKTIQNNRALEAAFKRTGLTDVSSHNMRKTFATRLLSRGAAITDVQHLLGHASVKTTEKAYAAFVKNERFKQTIDLLDSPVVPRLKIVK